MGSATLIAAATVPDWIAAISTAVIALGVVAAAIGWTRRQAKGLLDPGEAPDGSRGELREIIEDVLRDRVGTRSDRRQFRREMRDRQRDQPRMDRWQRYLRRLGRRGEGRKREARKRRRPVREAQVQVLASTADTEDESSTPSD